jgi:hypothetical protein
MEINDQYPYDIKNSHVKINYIRKHHKIFNGILYFTNGFIFVINNLILLAYVGYIIYIFHPVGFSNSFL